MATCESEPLPDGDPQERLIELVAPDEIELGPKLKTQLDTTPSEDETLTVKEFDVKLLTGPSTPLIMPSP